MQQIEKELIQEKVQLKQIITINPLLDKALKIKDIYNSFDLNDDIDNNINKAREISSYVNTLNDYSRTNSNSNNDNYYTKLTDHNNEETINFLKKDKNKQNINAHFLKLYQNKNRNEASKINNNLEFSKNSFIYTILVLILIISILMILIYKLYPNYLNDFYLLIYFVATLFIVFFIHILL